MSFIKKAFKKVVKVVKKVVKSKWFKYIAIAAAIVFTAGVAAGGFAAFAGVNTVGGFMTAVGQTIATGAASIAGGLGFQGASASLAAHGGAAATAAGLAGAPAASSLTLAAVEAGNILSPVVVGGKAITVAGAAAPAGSGIATYAGNLMSKPILGDVTVGQLGAGALQTGLTMALTGGKDKKEFPNGYVAGGLARGGSSEAPEALHFQTGEAPEGPTTPQDSLVEQGPSVAKQLAQTNIEQSQQRQDESAGRIRDLIAARGPYGSEQPSLVEQESTFAQESSRTDPRLVVDQPGQAQAQPQGRTFQDQSSQIQYDPRREGLV